MSSLPSGHIGVIASRGIFHRLQPTRLSRGSSGADLQTRLPGILRVSDWLGIAAIGFLLDMLSSAHEPEPLSHSLGVVLGATATLNYVHLTKAYEPRSAARLMVQLAKVSVAWAAAFVSLAAISYAVDRSEHFLSTWASLWFLTSWLFLVTARSVVALQISRWRRQGRLTRRVAVFGTGAQAIKLAQLLKAHSDEANVIGVFIDGDISMAPGDVTGDDDALAALASSGNVDEVILALPWSSHAALNRAIAKFAAYQVAVSIDPGISGIDFPPTGFSLVAGIPTLTVQRRPLSGWGAPVKRAEDVVLVLLLLLFLAPILLLIALLVMIDSRGPVLFRQERYGFNNNRIVVYKFRSMHHDSNPDPAVPQARRNDPRVTRVGAIIRRASLDELPQLFNVLRGDMSLVGPRPHATAHNEKYAALINGYLARHRMKPGITGWAQVNGWRGATETTEQMRRRLEHDIYYIENWSLLLDIKVLLMTLPVVAHGDNAY
ncbi:MAG: undecaprenyl-phosphate glucose phosphotransferase [Reyranella sp.]|uniref:undecaprenyl-phosphate glucose phosphotransferase n=1 Tax=Reyranella sp. TaxID=1929291 RepID=UPI001AC7C072|nr:undecaprenyl-phosphate glucose phosphotransferase [Reyranella sp.]MBN9090501.1 undecaprenyl-phosphate glucose phosphotransferase [Reyranella sp.]